MPNILRVNEDWVDDPIINMVFATILDATNQNISVTIGGHRVAVVNASIADHQGGSHNVPTDPTLPKMITGSSTVTIGGLAVCRVGDLASCGHVGKNGDSSVQVGG